MPSATNVVVRGAVTGLARVDRHAGTLFVAMSALAFILLLYLGRHGSFFQDEWSFIGVGGLGTLRDWFMPHNEHWSTVPFALYRALLLTVGLHSYLPYLALLLATHLLAAGAVFVLVRRVSGGIVALLAGGVFLVLGSGYQNLFWAFQIGFVGSTAAGLWALVAVERNRPRLAAVLLLVAVASSTMGLPFLVAAFVVLFLDPRTRRQSAWLVPVGIAFAAWFAVIGHQGMLGGSGEVFANVAGLPRFVVLGLVDSFGATFGLGRLLGGVLCAILAIVAAWALARRQLPVRAAASLAAVVALYALIGLGRGQLGDAQAGRSRYLYEGAAFVLIGMSAAIGRRADILRPGASGSARGGERGGDSDARRATTATRDAPSPRRPGVTAHAPAFIAAGLLVAGGVSNLRQLPAGARFFSEGAGELRATIALIEEYGDGLHIDRPPVDRWSLPSPAVLAKADREWGSPATDTLWPSVVRTPTARERDRALWRLVGNATRPRPTAAPSSAPSREVLADPASAIPSAAVDGRPPTVVTSSGAVLAATGECLVVRAPGAGQPTGTASSAPSTPAPARGMTVTLVLADGSAVVVTTVGGGAGALRLGRDAPPDRLDEAVVTYPDGSWFAIGVPRLGDGSVDTLQLLFPPAVRGAAVCPAT